MVDFDTEKYEEHGPNEKARFAYYMLVHFNNANIASSKTAPMHTMWAMHMATHWPDDWQVKEYKKQMLRDAGGLSAFLRTPDEIEYELTGETQKPNISFSDRQTAIAKLIFYQKQRKDDAEAALRASGGASSVLEQIANDGPPQLLPVGEA